MVTPKEALKAEAEYRQLLIESFRDQVDLELRSGDREITAPCGLLTWEEIELVLKECKTKGWHVRVEEDFFTKIHFSETPFPEPKGFLKSLLEWLGIR